MQNYKNSLFSFQNPEDFHRLRDVFEAAGYSDKGIIDAMGVQDFSSIKADDIPLLLHRTAGSMPIHTLIRLFLIKWPCDIDDVRLAIRPMDVETWVKAGIVRVNNSSVFAAVELLPFKDLLLAYDLPYILNSPLKQDYVMGIGSSTLTLANLTVRRHSRRTLDLGAGCAIHGLLASSHSERVIASDLNPRAIAFAEFNARINNISNMECIQGDLFEPVNDQRFDLVVSNPPFVISPETRYTYRDSGMEADHITRKIVQQVPGFLNEGGFCQLLCNWAEKAGRDWREHLKEWFSGSGCDVWVMRSETHDAANYASKWIRHTEMYESGQYSERFNKWMEYYKGQGIDAVSAGTITMRRSGKHPNWFRGDDSPEKMLGPSGDHVMRGFEQRDFLETVQDDDALLNSRLSVASDVCLERQSSPSTDGWIDNIIMIHMTKGLAYSANIDPFIANLLIGCNGKQQLRDLMNNMAASLSADPKDIRPAFCTIARGLIEKGYILRE
ncbi:putative Methyltransferase small [uncultured Desulfobacterium sp.]|uniref:Putative Methyltransferase small n=1 Tax=uncultured Desulfobacterium sp. TaxID=201089 RepID=A0A445MTJ6_9BACT|nr:putative Methyltransferase small [uncultured Desulfobacterium sp.]